MTGFDTKNVPPEVTAIVEAVMQLEEDGARLFKHTEPKSLTNFSSGGQRPRPFVGRREDWLELAIPQGSNLFRYKLFPSDARRPKGKLAELVERGLQKLFPESANEETDDGDKDRAPSIVTPASLSKEVGPGRKEEAVAISNGDAATRQAVAFFTAHPDVLDAILLGGEHMTEGLRILTALREVDLVPDKDEKGIIFRPVAK